MNVVLKWFLELTLPTIISILLEYRFGIIGRIKKAYFWIINKNAGFELNMTFKKINDFDGIKKEFSRIVREKFGSAKEKRNTSNSLEILTDNYLVTLNLLPNKDLFISTTRVECGIRQLKSKLSTFLGIITLLKKSKDISSKEVSFKVFIPFKWSYVNIRTPRVLNLKDYDIKFNEQNYNSIINLKMDSLSISGDETSLGFVLDNFIGIF